MTCQVVLDACVIYPMPIADTLLRAAEKEFYCLCLSSTILDEVTRAFLRNGKKSNEKAQRYRACIEKAFGVDLTESEVLEGTQSLDPSITSDLDDRHVVATAVISGSSKIVTYNLKDFNKEVISRRYGIDVQHPDEFLTEFCITEDGLDNFHLLLKEQSSKLKKPPTSLLQLLEKLENKHHGKVPSFVSKILSLSHGSQICEIAEEVLNTVCTKNIEGETYEIEKVQSEKCLKIFHKPKKEYILVKRGSTIECCHLSTVDIKKFLVIREEIQKKVATQA